MAKDYKDKMNLPRTSFPMRANLAAREPELLEFWKRSEVYAKLLARPSEATFVLHDGPPYANGNIHIGTAFNKILKDLIPKYKSMRGFRAPYVPGWDTHGLPIELRVLKEGGISKEQINPVELRRRCMAYASRFLDVQREEFRRLGVFGDWENPYVTFLPEYEAAQLGAFADMVERGLVYKGHKPVYWCTDCQTALATAEIEYEDKKSLAVYVSYPMPEAQNRFESLRGEEVSVVIWTTTPWTLPASMAVAFHGEYEYIFVREVGGKVLLLAKDLRERFSQETGLKLGEVLQSCRGRDLEGLTARHPFYDKSLALVLADYVELDQGTGCVHTAPGHGVDDFETGIKYGLDIYNPVDDRGYFMEGVPLVGGLSLDQGSQRVLDVLRESGRLLKQGPIVHSYPHCWRCKKPVIFRATEQWFIAVSAFRDQALQEIERVQWVPAWGEDRIANMVRERSDWCISRQRIWGVPIPAFTCDGCGQVVLTPDRVRRVQEQVRTAGSDIWWSASPEDLLGDLAFCPSCGARHLRKETNIMDVWFDSGVSHLAVLELRPGLTWPADLYLEGSDQHRGWFQTSLLTSVATRQKAPFRAVLTHGFIVDGEGRKMSKSLGNVMVPQEIIGEFGADILRLWVASTDYRNDIRISKKIVDNLVESYRRIRNTARFLLGNLYDFSPKDHQVSKDQMEEMDRWVLSRLQDVVRKATEGFESYEFHVPSFIIHQFCVNDISAIFMETAKDRLYASAPGDRERRSCQTVMWELLGTLTRLLAPVLSFTAEEIWQQMRKIDDCLPESVFLAPWPEARGEWIDAALEERWQTILPVRSAVVRALEKARAELGIGQSLEAAVSVTVPPALEPLMASSPVAFWADLCIVSAFSWSLASDTSKDTDEVEVAISRVEGDKCPRCWKYSSSPEGEEKLCPRCADALRRMETSA